MSPQPRTPPDPDRASVEIEIQTEKVDATLDLDDLLERIADGAEAAASDADASHQPEVIDRLNATRKLALDLSTQLKGIRAVDPELPRRMGRRGGPGPNPPDRGPRG